jgi:membrane fusion protein (multidrug efflux system)
MNQMTPVGAIEADGENRAGVSRWRRPLMVAGPLAVALVLGAVALSGRGTVSTDNAQVAGHVISIAPEVTGRVVAVAVTENQAVRKGDLLFRIDPEPYRIALMQADAAVGQARLAVAEAEGNYESKRADIDASSSDLRLARENFDRQRELLAKGFTTRANYDAARAALSSAEAKRGVARADAVAARALTATSPGGGHPQIEAAIAARAKAALDLQRTEVRAASNGRIAQTERLNVGAMATAMLPMVSIVADDEYWVEANFKETQLARIRPGQQAEVEIDALPGRPLKAQVTGIGAGTGSRFSVLPAQNATGNWVKVTQRVPVRLKLLEKPPVPLVAGASADVTVRVAD